MNERKARRPKRRSSNGFVDILNGFLTLLVLGLLLAGGVLLYGASQFYGDGPLQEETTFRVRSGSGLASTAQRLEEQGVISNRFIFRAGGRALERQGNIKAGDFRIPAGASMAEILKELTEGNPIRYAVTIPEGWTTGTPFSASMATAIWLAKSKPCPPKARSSPAAMTICPAIPASRCSTRCRRP
ncbi:endolytic transglycosylase MltG [Devosia sp. A8/3-2]|nr:endolytic transglycosylase MltG [Devosia sp. A8/3-2]